MPVANGPDRGAKSLRGPAAVSHRDRDLTDLGPKVHVHRFYSPKASEDFLI
jgi:hypothetical protein